MVIRHSGIVPELKSAFFRCVLCDHTETREVSRGWINEPTQCPRCRGRECFTLVHNRSLYADKQVVKLQETPESIPEGSTPQTVTLCVYEDMVDVARPGDRVRVTGIYRACPIRARSTQRTLKHIYRTFLDVVHFQISGSDLSEQLSNRLNEKNRGNEAEEKEEDEKERKKVGVVVVVDDNELYHEVDTERHARIQRIRNLARDPHIYTKLTKSFGSYFFLLFQE
jgi:DNA replication licensing factor MCM4